MTPYALYVAFLSAGLVLSLTPQHATLSHAIFGTGNDVPHA